jgi:hypothetical protein
MSICCDGLNSKPLGQGSFHPQLREPLLIKTDCSRCWSDISSISFPNNTLGAARTSKRFADRLRSALVALYLPPLNSIFNDGCHLFDRAFSIRSVRTLTLDLAG